MEESKLYIKPRCNNFDILRVFAAVLVIYGHSYPLLHLPEPMFARNGVATIGIKIFFVISGYLIAGSWLNDPSIWRFMSRRALRIFPALMMVILVSTFVLGPILTTLPIESYFSHSMTFDYLKNIALYIHFNLPGVFASNFYPYAVNGSLWSLPVEVSLYLLTPPVIWIFLSTGYPKLGMALFCVIFATASLYFLIVVPRDGQLILYLTDVWSWLSVAPYFVIGMAYAVCGVDKFANIYIAFLAIFALALCTMEAAATELALMIVLPYVCLAFGLGQTAVFRKLTRRGDFSYGLYLYAFPVQQLLALAFRNKLEPWLNFVGATLICFILAYLSWHVIEKPALKLKHYGPKRNPIGSLGTAIVDS